jgi:hypothetical protein
LEDVMRFHKTAIIGGLVAVVLACSQLFAAGPAAAPAPEIDGGSLAAGLGVLSAGILILRARRR